MLSIWTLEERLQHFFNVNAINRKEWTTIRRQQRRRRHSTKDQGKEWERAGVEVTPGLPHSYICTKSHREWLEKRWSARASTRRRCFPSFSRVAARLTATGSVSLRLSYNGRRIHDQRIKSCKCAFACTIRMETVPVPHHLIEATRFSFKLVLFFFPVLAWYKD